MHAPHPAWPESLKEQMDCHGTGYTLRPRAERLGVLVPIAEAIPGMCQIRIGFKGVTLMFTDGHWVTKPGPDPETALALAILAAEAPDGH